MPPPEKGGFRHLGERQRYDGSFIKLVTGTYLDPAGFTFERDVIRHTGAVCVVPLESDGSVLMVRQYRAPFDTAILELPAGKLDKPGEELEEAARRELREEVGCTAGRVTELGSFYNSPGFTDELTTLYLAEELTHVGQAVEGIEEQHMTVERVQLADLWDLFAAGELLDAKSIIGMALALRALAARDGAG